MQQQAFTPKEACEVLRCGRTKLYQLLADGKLKAVHLGRKTLIPAQELERFLSDLPPFLAGDPNTTEN